MTTALSLVAQLGSKGIQLWLDDSDNLRFKAPKGALTEELKQAIIANKPEIIALLKQSRSQDKAIEKLTREPNALYPLSFSQQRFYFLQQLQENDVSLNIPAALSLQGELNIAALEQAIQALSQRHEILRTVFVADDQEIKQQVLAQLNYPLERLNLAKENTIEQAIEQLACTPFQLLSTADEPRRLLRFQLAQTTEQQTYLLINLHHIISDGWSIRLLIQELMALYQNAVSGQTLALAEPALQYIDYAVHQQEQWQQECFKDDLSYWETQLADAPILDFPLDYPRPKLSKNPGQNISLELDSALLNQLRAFATQQQSSNIAVLLAAFAYLLSRYSGQNDICIGTPTAGREQAQLEQVMGCFINLLTLRHTIKADHSFADLVAQSRQTLLAAQEHSSLPFEKIAEQLVENRSTSFSPLFQVLLTHQQELAKQFSVADLTIELLDIPSFSAKYDMQLHIDEQENSATVSIEYNSELFAQTTMQQLAKDYIQLLSLALAAPNTPLQQLPLFAEQLAVLTKPADSVSSTTSIKKISLNLENPENTAVSRGEQSASYAELQQLVAAFGTVLEKHQIGVGSRVALLLDAGIEQMAALFAVIGQGAAYIPVDTRYPQERINLMLEHSKPDLVIDKELAEQVLATNQAKEISANTAEQADSLLYLIFTSGSTGTPKGAGVSYANELNLLNWYIPYFQFNAQDKWLVFSALGFDLTQKNLLAPMVCGAEIVFPDSEFYDPEHLLTLIGKHQITVINCAPSAFYPIVHIAKQQGRLAELSSLRWLLFGGETIALDSLQAWIDSPYFNTQIGNMYGPTECTDITTTHILNTDDIRNHRIPIGEAISGVHTYVLDDNLQPVPVGSVGELYIGGTSVGLGYFEQDDLTAEAFIANPFDPSGDTKLYKTGDSVRFLRNAWPKPVLEFIARKDEQVKIRGYRIELGEIAQALNTLADIQDAKVFADDNQQALIAYYIADKTAELSPNILRAALEKVLPDYMLPSAFVPVATWPLSPNGKIDRKKLPAIAAEHRVQHQYLAPQTLLQQQLCQLWQAHLSLEQVGISDNFFELGGHSLSAASLIADINQQFQSAVSLADFFEQPTIQTLSQAIEIGAEFSEQQSLLEAKADRSQSIPLSYAQQRLWIIEQLNPGLSTYNIPLALELRGQLNTAAIIQALQSLIERHESLRTRIGLDGQGEPCQIIDAVNDDFAKWFKQEILGGEQAIEQVFNQFATTAFDLSQDALLRITLLDCSKDYHVLMVNMHHIISDGWSLSVLQQELSTLYTAYNQNTANPLPALAVQYADFSAWQQSNQQEEQQEKHLSYWQEKLSNIPKAIELPFDRPRGEQQSFNGALFKQSLTPELNAKLQQFSQANGLSLFHSLLAVYALWLNKLSQQNTVCIGTPVSGRENPLLQNLIGYFVNAVVLRCDFDGNPSFKTYCQNLQQESFAAFAHQDIAIEKVLEQLNLERNASYPPVAQVGFSFIGKELAQPMQLDDLSVTPLDFEQVVAKYELTLIAIEQQHGIELNIEYNSDLFDANTIENLFSHFVYLLEQSLAEPEQSLQQLSLFSEQELTAQLGINPSDVEGIYPLTAMQKDMVFSQWFNPESLANTLGYRAELNTFIDATRWQQACQITCDIEPITRTHFYANSLSYGETAYQVVLKQLEIELDVMDYRQENLDEATINQRVDAFIYQPQAYANNQFIRYGLMRISDTRTILLLSSHHALLDGVAIVLIAQQAAKHYEALSQGESIDLQGKAFAMAEAIENDKKHRDTQEVQAFWQQQFSHCEALDFPQAVCSSERKQVVKQHLLGSELSQALKQYCRQHRMTTAQLIKLVYGLLVSHYCRAENNFYFSEFNAGRNRSNALELGCYFEQSPFIFPAESLNQHSDMQSLFAYLRDYRKKIKGFDSLSLAQTQKLAPHGRLHFMYNYYHFFPQEQTLQGCAIECIEMPPFIDNTVQFVAKEKEQDIQIDLYYQSDVFNDFDFLARLQSLLQQLVDGVEVLSELNLLLPNEQAILQGDTIPLEPSFSSIPAVFAQQAEQTPNAIALIDDEGELSYSELQTAIYQMVDYLQQQGVKSGQRVGVLLPRNRHAIIAIYAAIHCGAAYVPMDSNYPAERLQVILEEAGIEHLIADTNTSTNTDAAIHTHTIADINLAEYSDKKPELAINPEQALYVIFTSGSTGKPKGAAVSHSNSLNLLQWYLKDSEFNADSTTLIISAQGFDLTQKNLFAPLLSGGKLLLSELPHYDSGKIQQLIEAHQVSHINCAPSAFYPLVEQNSERLRSLKQVMLGGEAIQLQRLNQWLTNSLAKLKNHYGPTECTDIALRYNIQGDESPLPLGTPNDNVKVFISNRFGQVLPQGLSGEICISGASLGLGYLNDDITNQEAFINSKQGRYYKTGDLGYLQNQQAYFIGRKDFQIKLRGLRIELGEIESALKQQSAISDALVLVHEEQLIAYVLSMEPIDTAQIQQALQSQLPNYMVPNHIVVLEQWPLTANGKINRKALPLPDLSASTVAYVAPRDEIEQAICDILQKVLNLAKVGVHDNFFDLGGHSLAASRAIVQIREHFQVDIPLNVLFDMTTVEKLANYIRAAQWAVESAQHHEDEEGRDSGFI